MATMPPPPQAFEGWAHDPDPPPEATSIASVINALYSSVSREPDADRFRRLCAPFARVMVTQRNDRDQARPIVLTVDEYLQSVSDRFPESDVHEYETGRQVQQFGAIGHVISAWVAVRDGAKSPIARGVNSMQLFHDGARWWLLSVLADIEREGAKIPDILKQPGALPGA